MSWTQRVTLSRVFSELLPASQWPRSVAGHGSEAGRTVAPLGDDRFGQSSDRFGGGDPFKQFIEQHRLSWTAWCASSSWGPPMFNMDYSLRVGPGQMGGFAKDWIYEKRDADRPTP